MLKVKPALGMLLFLISLFSCKQKPMEEIPLEDQVAKKADSLINLMSIEEKVHMIHASSSFTSGGVERLGIPEWTMSDGPHGVRMEHGRDWELDEDADDAATYLPTGVGLASTWNPDLGYKFGEVLGSEANYRGKDVILGPGINIMRTPLNGRNFEYLSEDPYLISKMVVGYIKGVQDQGIAACVKHYIANNQETARNTINIKMDERTLREIYLPGFKAAVQEGGVYTVMGAYNKFRGQYCTHNEYLIKYLLKEELGFKGAVISDWGAVHNTREALLNGTDVEMGTDLSMLPDPDYGKFYMGDTVVSLVKNNKVAESVIDDKVRRILGVMYKTNMFDERKPGAFNTKEHQNTALKIAEEAIVLLKNDNVLPLKKAETNNIAVIGANATKKHASGGGSSQVNAKYEVTPLEGIKNIANENAQITFAQGYKIAEDATADDKLIQEAVNAAKNSETAIVVGGFVHGYSDAWSDNAYDAEGTDKPDIQLPFGQDELINAVIEANPNTIVVLYGGGPSDMSKWVDKAKGIIQAWYPGMEGGNALAEIIFGEVNPSGKLPVTFPKKLNDSPAHAMDNYPFTEDKTLEYKEGVFVGYRYFDSKNIEPQFCFGHGLSYTTFEYGDLNITSTGNNGYSIKLKVTNTGNRQGKEVVQLYIKDDESSVDRPEKELKAFKKIALEAGESKEVELTIDASAFKYFDTNKGDWYLEPGKFEILVGASSKDIRLSESVTL